MHFLVKNIIRYFHMTRNDLSYNLNIIYLFFVLLQAYQMVDTQVAHIEQCLTIRLLENHLLYFFVRLEKRWSVHQQTWWTKTNLDCILTSHGLLSLSLLKSITELIQMLFKISQCGVKIIM